MVLASHARRADDWRVDRTRAHFRIARGYLLPEWNAVARSAAGSVRSLLERAGAARGRGCVSRRGARNGRPRGKLRPAVWRARDLSGGVSFGAAANIHLPEDYF